MALDIKLDLPTSPTPLTYFTLEKFNRGVITVVDQSRLPKNALKEMDNLWLVEDGVPSIRPGTDYYGSVSPNASAWDGMDYYQASDGTSHLVGVAGGTVYRSINDAVTWTACTGATLTSGLWCDFEQSGGYLNITNGTDNIVRYDGTTVLQVYTALTTPAAPTIVETGLTGTANNYYYKVSAVNSVGFSIASSASAVVQANLDRTNWDATTNYATLTLPAFQATQTRADVFVSDDNVNFYYLGSTATTTFVDDGSWVVSPYVTAPTSNTSQGPKVKELTNVGTRMYGVRDTVNKYRIWYSGSGNYAGYFSSAYDGGWIDWQPGGKYLPVHVEDYRDGKGTPLATVWCDSADGQGCILQMSLDTLTIADVSITVPNIYKLPGSRGTPAPWSVVNVLNDYFFYNSQAFYNLGSRAQFLNLLSTDEASGNIRPTVKQIASNGESNIVGTYFDARVFFSYSVGQTTNNYTAIFDTERKAWIPRAFTIGFSKFLRYTDNSTDKNRKLLALRPGDNRITEISTSIRGDYGTAFTTSLITGLYPLSKNRFDFQWVEEGEIELSNQQGQVNIELIGIERTRGYSTTNTNTIQPRTTMTGHSTYEHSTRAHTDTSDAIDTFSESSIKRYFNIQKELNAVQWKLTTNTIDSFYIMRTMQTNGRPTYGGKPRAWKL
jgi:hypothetical protein